MKLLRRILLGLLVIPLICASAIAQDVTLTSRDQSIELTGTLLGYDGEFYRIDTVYGELTLDGSGVLCSGPGCPNLESYVAELTLSGSASMGRVLLPALIQGFARHYGYQAKQQDITPRLVQYRIVSPETGDLVGVFSLKLSTSNEGFADLLTNEADIAMSRRLVSTSEQNMAYAAELGDLSASTQQKVVALDALVTVVSSEIDMTGLTLTQIASLADGSLDNWVSLNGEDAPLFFDPPTADDVQSLADQMRKVGVSLEQVSAGQLISDISSNPLAIALMNLSEIQEEMRVLPIIGECGIALVPTSQNIRTADYPLTAPMTLYRPMRRMPKMAQEFWDYLDSPSAQRVVHRSGFVNQQFSETEIAVQGNRLANAISSADNSDDFASLQKAMAILKGRRRLNITYRFDEGGFDAQSLGNIDRLARMVDRGDLDGRTVLFAGFDEADSLKLADDVRRAVEGAVKTDKSEVEFAAVGLGSVMPIACVDASWGQVINRRVEIWLR